MLSNLTKLLVAGALILAATVIPASAASQYTRTFEVDNRSSYRINHLYVSPIGYRYWGFDRLGSDILYPNYYVSVTVVPGWYDVKLVDQDGDSCVVPSVDFRSGDTWTLTDRVLVACELFSRQ
jgi:hypothetical protein